MPENQGMPKEQNLSYDSIIKEFIERLSDVQLIKFINAAYGKNLPLNSMVYKLWTESNVGRRRLSDLYIRISDSTFHLEIQSYDDSQMVLRMFEYGLRGAMQNDKTYNKDRLTITFPSPVILYLRGNPPDKLEMDIVFPHINKTMTYPVPAISLSSYTLAELTNKKLLPLLMFYPMKYEDLPKKATSPEQLRESFIAEVKSLPGLLDNLHNSGELTNTQIDTIVNVFVRIAAQTISKTKIMSLKGDETAMSEVAKLETIKVRDFYAELEESEKQAEKKGIVKGVTKMLRALMANGSSALLLKPAALEAGLSEDEFNKIVKEVYENKRKKQKTTSKSTNTQ